MSDGRVVPRLSVLIPAFNESGTVRTVVEAVRRAWDDLEIILVDDGSSDDTWNVIMSCADGVGIRCIRHDKNRGKGAAVRSGLLLARGDIVLIQDADLEQDPRDYPALLEPLLSGKTKVVFGSRFHRDAQRRGHRSLWYTVGNRAVTIATNLIYFTHLSDMENGYKIMPRSIALQLDLQARGFDIEPEITAKLLRLGHTITEVPVSYRGRTRAEGKKITARDGIRAIRVLLKYRWWQPKAATAGPHPGADPDVLSLPGSAGRSSP
jgi:glycosyltransferase involved in cell wall biosynthesis